MAWSVVVEVMSTIVRATARFNEHRPLIRALFKHPPARRILFRAMIA